MGWHREPLIGFDLETTGTDPHEARIVTGAVIEVRAGEPLGRREWLADPGVPIPVDAVAVHGIGIAGTLTAHERTGAPAGVGAGAAR